MKPQKRRYLSTGYALLASESQAADHGPQGIKDSHGWNLFKCATFSPLRNLVSVRGMDIVYLFFKCGYFVFAGWWASLSTFELFRPHFCKKIYHHLRR